MITIGMLLALENNDGLTLRKGNAVRFKTGYEVATEGIVTTKVTEAYKAIIDYNGTCGVWYSEGVYYIDRSHWVKTRRDAIAIDKAHNQISIFRWRDAGLIFLGE